MKIFSYLSNYFGIFISECFGNHTPLNIEFFCEYVQGLPNPLPLKKQVSIDIYITTEKWCDICYYWCDIRFHCTILHRSLL